MHLASCQLKTPKPVVHGEKIASKINQQIFRAKLSAYLDSYYNQIFIMGNTIGTPAPEFELQGREEDHRPRNEAPEIHDIQPLPRNVQPVNRRVLRVPRCLNYTRAACGRGNDCHFVHEGDDPQHQAPRPRPNLHEPNLGRPLGENNLQVQRVCRYFAQGHCYRGAQCPFLHDNTRATVAENQVRQSFIDSFGHISQH